MTRRVLSIWLPRWSTDRLRRSLGDSAPSRDLPLILKANDGRQRLITAVDYQASRLGLSVGMPVSKAQTLVSNLEIRDGDAAADAEALEKVAIWLLRYTPIVAPDAPDGLILDTTGADHLQGGEANLLSRLTKRLSSVGVTSRVAMADTWGAAWAFARHGRQNAIIVPAGQSSNLALDLPVAALRLPADVLQRMKKVGFELIRDVASQPRAPLALRYGPELGRRLDQLVGRIVEPITPIRPVGVIEVEKNFMEPISAPETIARYTQLLAQRLSKALAAALKGARQIDLFFQRVDNQIDVVRVGTAEPLRDPAAMFRLLKEKIQTVDPGFGIEKMIMAATEAEPLGSLQAGASFAAPSRPDVTSIVDVFANRLGQDACYKLAPVSSAMPERSFKRVSPLESLTGRSWPLRWPRPSRLFSTPERIEAMALLPDNPPAMITWRGSRIRVQTADGPERLRGEWWVSAREDRSIRDYYQLVDHAGKRYWVFRSGDGQNPDTGTGEWFIHGLFG